MSQHEPETQKIKTTKPPEGGGASTVLILLPLVLVIAGTVAWYAMNQGTSHPVASASHEEANSHVEPAVEMEPAPEPEPEPETEPEPAAPAAPAKATPRRSEPKVSKTKAPAESRETHTETPVADATTADIKAEPAPPSAPALNEEVAVKHKHRIGSCEGVLRVSADRLEYDSSHKDAFSVALSDVERFSREEEDLTVKVRDGRTYNFSPRDENQAALARFHEQVSPALPKN